MNLLLVFVIRPYKVSNHQKFPSSIVKTQNDNEMLKGVQELMTHAIIRHAFCLQA